MIRRLDAPLFADQVIGEPSDLSVCPAHKGQFGLFIRTFGGALDIPEQEKMPSSVWPASLMRFPITTRNWYPRAASGGMDLCPGDPRW